MMTSLTFFFYQSFSLRQQMKSVIAVALVASASAFVPAQNAQYDDKLWDHDAKKEVYNKWDPASARGSRNFNPFETFKGNSPDASGIYPGEARYKDPKRGDVSYAIMMVEKADIEDMTANPKAGSEPGCAGCKS
ncbi:hypothetical protein QTG54_010646 [Skeletonema marinoi]|uniref:Uncharacterized protein n=1 Tax=Skeletonema marinoi TaxID=267567 RepID=A0AAD8Y4E6_9STRA|nr:hypothetical protein QTG54_010646 [Skeletonema marinoi]